MARLQEERWRLAWGIPVKARGLLLNQFLREWLAVAPPACGQGPSMPMSSARVLSDNFTVVAWDAASKAA